MTVQEYTAVICAGLAVPMAAGVVIPSRTSIKRFFIIALAASILAPLELFYIPALSAGITALLFFTLRLVTRKLADCMREKEMVFMQILMPRKEGKEEKEREKEQFSGSETFTDIVAVMDHLFSAIFTIYDSRRLHRFFFGQPFISVEYAALEGDILFYFVVPRSLVHIVEKQITSFYPDAVIEEVEDYNIFTPKSVTSSTYLQPYYQSYKPFRTYEILKSDPLNLITNAFSKLSKDEGAAIQIVLRPKGLTNWHKACRREAQKLLNPKRKSISWWNPINWFYNIWITLMHGTERFQVESGENQSSGERVSQVVEEMSKIMDQKGSSSGYNAVIRIVTSASSDRRSSEILDAVVGSFQQFNDINGNLFERTRHHNHKKLIEGFVRRKADRSLYAAITTRRLILSTMEIASFFHFPNIQYNKVQTIKWQNYKIIPAPRSIPDGSEPESIKLGTNIYRGEKRDIYIKHLDRFRHFYIIGQTGTGKSSMITVMAEQDFRMGHGCCIIDPHGSLCEELIGRIPRERADDVIYFNPADTERPMGMNMLEGKTEEERDLIALDAMNMMVKMFGEEIFGPRIQDYFRNGCLTLMSDPDEGGAITDLVRLFTDDEWQQFKVSKVQNTIVRSFWEKQMAQTGQREKQEMIPYFAAKFGQFTTNTLIRNIVGQTKSAFDFSDVMDNRKILLMNLSKGLIGDINSQLLGMIVVNKVQVAAMRRQKLSSEARTPFFLYIDEFQNYVTESIESILSEARKYRLGLILAHQYLDQLEKENKLSSSVNLKGAIFGNVGSMIFYKIGAQDAEFCAKEMSPVFSEDDLVNIDKYKAVMKLSVDTQPSRPFSITPVNPYEVKPDQQAGEAFKQLSRLKYGREKQFVSREIERRIGATGGGAMFGPSMMAAQHPPQSAPPPQAS